VHEANLRAHVLAHPQLDAGVPERVMLLARDETSMLVVSYADLKRCVDSAYTDLQTRAASAMHATAGKFHLHGAYHLHNTPTAKQPQSAVK
jgi:hypothetical protein